MNLLGIFVFLCIVCLVILFAYEKRRRNFFSPVHFPSLRRHLNRSIILEELQKDNEWLKWPETDLYKENSWSIIPFIAFGKNVTTNCNKYPKIHAMLKKINPETALLSKMNAHTKLKTHRGWAQLSNRILRCHYGVVVPKKKCKMVVNGEEQYIENDKIIVFDDSLPHYAENNSSNERIVLIIDMKRPFYVQRGTSTIETTPKLIQFVREHLH